MDRSWVFGRQFSKEHIDGVGEFMKLVREKFDKNAEILCPCRKCLNRIQRAQSPVEDHIFIYGMSSTYTMWTYHGEEMEVQTEITANEQGQEPYCPVNDPGDHEEEDPNDRIPDMVADMYTASEQYGGQSMFSTIIEELKRELQPGSANHSRFQFVVKLLHIKSFYRISNVAFTALLNLLSSAFPASSIPASYSEAKKFVQALGLGYESIHACPKNCVLFRHDYKNLNECPFCKSSRWKTKSDGSKPVPAKVLRHFPLISRLKRMFACKKTAEEAQWHKLKRKPVENELRHPADGEAWKDFDIKFSPFANDPRNIRLSVATDGFNPFGNMSTSYSMWPVFVRPLNMAPWTCMGENNLMMSLLILGPECPGKDFDVFLQPLVEELLDLWKGVDTYDAFSGTMFPLRAAIIWCVHDYPALSTLSGRVTKGYYACVRCDKNPCSVKLRNKIVYIETRRWLERNHPWRRRRDFNGHTDTRGPPEEFTTEELLEQLERVEHVRPGDHPANKKRKRLPDGQCRRARR